MQSRRTLLAFLLMAVSTSPAAGSWQWTASEEARLDSTTPVANDELGKSIAQGGSTLVIGSPGANQGAVIDAGEALVFERSGANWTPAGTLQGSDTVAGDHFGSAVALSGDTLVVGASREAHLGPETGAAYVFVRSGGTWSELQKLVASDGGANSRFGEAAALQGDTLMIGAPFDRVLGLNQAGSAYVFERNGSVWSETQKLTASNTSPIFQFGFSMSIDGDLAGIGAFGALRIYVFERSAGTWCETTQLSSPTQAHAQGIGRSVGVSGLTIVFGSPNDDLINPLGANAGSAFVYAKRNGNWTMETKLKASDYAKEDHFGRSVAIEGDLIVVGAERDDTTAVDTGSAYLFSRSGTDWTEQDKLLASDAGAGDLFGWSCALDQGRIAVGAPEASGDGAGYVFALTPPPARGRRRRGGLRLRADAAAGRCLLHRGHVGCGLPGRALVARLGQRARAVGLRGHGRERRGRRGRPLLLRLERSAKGPLGQRHEPQVRAPAGSPRRLALGGRHAERVRRLHRPGPQRPLVPRLPASGAQPRGRRDGADPALVPGLGQHVEPDDELLGRARVRGRAVAGRRRSTFSAEPA